MKKILLALALAFTGCLFDSGSEDSSPGRASEVGRTKSPVIIDSIYLLDFGVYYNPDGSGTTITNRCTMYWAWHADSSFEYGVYSVAFEGMFISTRVDGGAIHQQLGASPLGDNHLVKSGGTLVPMLPSSDVNPDRPLQAAGIYSKSAATEIKYFLVGSASAIVFTDSLRSQPAEYSFDLPDTIWVKDNCNH